MVGEDAGNRDPEPRTALGRTHCLEDMGDTAGVFVPIVKLPQPLVAAVVGGFPHSSLELVADDSTFPVRGEGIIRNPAFNLRIGTLQAVQCFLQEAMGLFRCQIHRHRGHAILSSTDDGSRSEWSPGASSPSHRARYSVSRAAPLKTGMTPRTRRAWASGSRDRAHSIASTRLSPRRSFG